jgi:ParB family chromosome partitioning protein
MSQRRGLGRGLGALIPTSAAEQSPAAEADPPIDLREGTPTVESAPTGSSGLDFREIPVDAVRPNPRQPRQVFDEDALAELVNSISTIGLLQPIVVRPAGDGFELVAGERRLRASKEAGLTEIPAFIRRTEDEAMLRDALLENLHRAALNPLEEAAAYQQLLADFGCTQEELATRVARSRSQVTNTLRLLKLPPGVQRRVAAGVLSAGHARALLGADDAEHMEALAGRIVAEGLSVRAVEELVVLGKPDRPPPRGRSRRRQTPIEYETAAERLSEVLETRVRIEAGKAKGRIIVEFAEVDDLARIVEIMDRPASAG